MANGEGNSQAAPKCNKAGAKSSEMQSNPEEPADTNLSISDHTQSSSKGKRSQQTQLLLPWVTEDPGLENLVKKRLDRALCNWPWRIQFPSAEVYTLPAIGSDHSPLLLTLEPPDPRCTICQQHPETVEHLFALCSSVAEPQTKSLVAGTIWQIWKERNAFIFHGRPPNPRRALEDATSMMLL